MPTNNSYNPYFDILFVYDFSPYYTIDKGTERKDTRYNDNLKLKDLKIKNVIFNDPATIVWFNDGSKTVVKCQKDEVFDKEKGLAMAIVKRLYGNKGSFNEVFKKYC